MSINALAITTTTSAISSSAYSISVEDTSRFESESIPFYISVSPAGETATPDNTEIMQVVNVSSGVLEVERGQLNTEAKAFDAGVYVYRGIYDKDLVAPRQLPAGSYDTTTSWATLWSEYVASAYGAINNAIYEYDPDFDSGAQVYGLPVYRAFRIVLTSSMVRITGEDTNGNVVKYFADISGSGSVVWQEDNGFYTATYDTTNSTQYKAIFKVNTGHTPVSEGYRFRVKFSRVINTGAQIYLNINGEELMAVGFSSDGASNSQPQVLTNVGSIRIYEFVKMDVPSVDIGGTIIHNYMAQCLNAFQDPFKISGDNYSYIQLGSTLICFGTKTWNVSSTGAYGEANSGTITFPKAFASAPQVSVTPRDLAGNCGEYSCTANVTATSFSIWAGHVASTSSTQVTADWIAIGQAAS